MQFTDNLVLNNEWVDSAPTKQKEHNMRITRNSVEAMSPQEFYDNLLAFGLKGETDKVANLVGEYLAHKIEENKKSNPEVVDNSQQGGFYRGGYYASNSNSSLANMKIEEI